MRGTVHLKQGDQPPVARMSAGATLRGKHVRIIGFFVSWNWWQCCSPSPALLEWLGSKGELCSHPQSIINPSPIPQLSSLPRLPIVVPQLRPKSLRLSKVGGTRRVKRPGSEQKNWDSLRMLSSGRSTLRELSQSEEKQTLQHARPLGVCFAPLIGRAWR